MIFESLANSASIIAGFATAMLVFRIQRELQMAKERERIWLPWADWLLIIAALLSFMVVILQFSPPILPEPLALNLAEAAVSSSAVSLSGYLFAILAHYRLILGKSRSGPRGNPEPSERVIVWITLSVAAVWFLLALFVMS